MIDNVVDELEVTVEARQAARDFATALTRTAEFKAFESASDTMQQDPVAQRALTDFQAKQSAAQTSNPSPAEQAELNRLYQVFLDVPSVAALLEAQADLQTLCGQTAEYLSDRIGLNYAAVCGSCHCG
jgi:cell fate (sporulation/competence/biofilm development) regulator YlbF (YheA/YmcA/DUF963 family)